MCKGIGVVWGISFTVMLLLDKVSVMSLCDVLKRDMFYVALSQSDPRNSVLLKGAATVSFVITLRKYMSLFIFFCFSIESPYL